MHEQKLIITPFAKALVSLEKALAQEKNEYTRDAVIKRFEYTYELCWKLLKRYFQQETGILEFNIKNIFREAAKQNMITEVDRWFAYHEARNLTSHTYNEITEEETYRVAKEFASDARQLLITFESLLKHATDK